MVKLPVVSLIFFFFLDTSYRLLLQHSHIIPSDNLRVCEIMSVVTDRMEFPHVARQTDVWGKGS